MNEGRNEEGRNHRPPQERPRQQNVPRNRQNNTQAKNKQQQAPKPESPPATYVRKEAGAQHQPKCQDTAPLPPLKLEVVQQLWLEANFFMVLTKRAVQHPNAQFYCKLCNYYCMSFGHCEQHIKDLKHEKNVKAEGKLTTIINLPDPTQSHFEAISTTLFNTFKKHGLVDTEKQARIDYAAEIDTLITTELPGCRVHVYGSSLTGIAVKNADLNLDFEVAKELPAPDMLKRALQVLSASPLAVDVLADFTGDIPSVSFTNEAKVHNCVLSLNHHDASSTCKLVEMYTKLDPRVKPLGCCFRHWAKLCKIDNVETAMLPSYSYSLLLIFFLQQVEPPVLPVISEISEDVPDWLSRNTMSLGELWYRLFKFYAVDFPDSKNIVCIRQKEPLSKTDKQWTSRKIAIEDPYMQKRNVSRYLVSVTYDFIMKCFATTYQYFAVPQTDIGPLIGTIRLPLEKFLKLPDVQLNIVRAEQGAIDMMDKDPKRFVKSTEGKKVYSVEELESGVENLAVANEKLLGYGFYSNRVVTPAVAKAMCLRLKKDAFQFEFSARFFAQDHPVVCNICLLEGHTRNDCPDIFLPPLLDLPPMHSNFLRELDSVCKQEMENWLPSSEEVMERRNFVQDLQNHLQRRYPTVSLDLFGSSCNGFGFRKSDLDICLTFTDNPTGEGINDVALIEELGNELKTYEQLNNLLTITTAKVPIIKFTYPRIRVECDISLYNTLAQRNTQMLRFYTQIDPRVTILGFTLKRFAKLCDICDASRGSLSSYAYILMAIYFLQQCNPPVIPVLQELYKGDTQPKLLVEGWNTWFFDDLAELSEVWPDYGKNVTSVGELWYQMLRFYTEEFDFNEYVVSIKQKAKLGRFQKLWTSKCIAIEDPFDLNHNLGSGLSRKMNNFIIKALRKGRMHFGTPISREEVPPAYRELRDYLFDVRFLTEGTVPNDRGCRICKKIGHLARNCPRSQQQQKVRNQKATNMHNTKQPPQRREQERPQAMQRQQQMPLNHHHQQQQQQQQHHQQQQQQMHRQHQMPQMAPHHPGQQQQRPFRPVMPPQQNRPPPQQANGTGTPSPPLPQSPTKSVPANSSPAFDNFMRLMQGRGASPMMQVPPGFAPQQPQQRMFFQQQPQQQQQQQQQQSQHQSMFRPLNGIRPPNQQHFYGNAPHAHRNMWPGGMNSPQQQQQGAPMFQQQQQQQQHQGMRGHPPVGSQQQQ